MTHVAPEGRSIARQVVELGAGRGVAAVLAAVWLFAAANLLSVPEFGSVALLLAVGMIVGVLSDVGLTVAVADSVAADPSLARPIFRQVVRVRVVLVIPAAVLLLVGYRIGSDSGDIVPAVLFIGSLAGTAVYASAAAVCRGVGDARADAVNEVASRLFVLVVGVALLLGGGGVRTVAAVYAAADLLSGVALAVRVRRLPDGPGQASKVLELPRVVPLALCTILGTALWRVDAWLLSLFASDAVVGRYSGAYRILDGLTLPATAVAAIAVPAYRWRPAAGADGRMFRIAALTGLATAVPAAAAMALAEPLLRVTLGSDYVSSADVLRILAASAPVTAAFLVLLPRAVLGHGRAMSCVLLGGLVANVAGNLLLIPRWSAAGAAAVTLTTQVFLLAATVAVVHRRTAPGSPAP